MTVTKAHIKPELLRWARDRAKVTSADAAKAANVPEDRLAAWESGDESPTVNQLRSLAKKYHFPLAIFFLPEPPRDFAPLRDYRRLPDAVPQSISANLAYQIRLAQERREIALELFHDLDSEPQHLPFKATLKDDPEAAGRSIREYLGVLDAGQKKSAGTAFDFWRRRLEERDILVFVVSGPHFSVELAEMRGFAIAKPELPVIVVNGKDGSQGGKAFTLLHELCHILLGESALSNDAADDPELGAAERRVERFCDQVAAAALMPRSLLRTLPGVAGSGARAWAEAELRELARSIGVSKEALLLRFITVGRATWDYYLTQRAQYRVELERLAEEEKAREKKAVKIARPIMLMSWNGRGYTRLVLRSYYDNRITLSDVSGFLGAKVNHIPALERAAFRPSE